MYMSVMGYFKFLMSSGAYQTQHLASNCDDCTVAADMPCLQLVLPATVACHAVSETCSTVTAPPDCVSTF